MVIVEWAMSFGRSPRGTEARLQLGDDIEVGGGTAFPEDLVRHASEGPGRTPTLLPVKSSGHHCRQFRMFHVEQTVSSPACVTLAPMFHVEHSCGKNATAPQQSLADQ